MFACSVFLSYETHLWTVTGEERDDVTSGELLSASWRRAASHTRWFPVEGEDRVLDPRLLGVILQLSHMVGQPWV